MTFRRKLKTRTALSSKNVPLHTESKNAPPLIDIYVTLTIFFLSVTSIFDSAAAAQRFCIYSEVLGFFILCSSISLLLIYRTCSYNFIYNGLSAPSVF